MTAHISHSSFFFFNDTATTEIYTLSLHDALPILIFSLARQPWISGPARLLRHKMRQCSWRLRGVTPRTARERKDRKSTRLNSSHSQISYAVFCLKKKKKTSTNAHT